MAAYQETLHSVWLAQRPQKMTPRGGLLAVNTDICKSDQQTRPKPEKKYAVATKNLRLASRRVAPAEGSWLCAMNTTLSPLSCLCRSRAFSGDPSASQTVVMDDAGSSILSLAHELISHRPGSGRTWPSSLEVRSALASTSVSPNEGTLTVVPDPVCRWLYLLHLGQAWA